MVTRIVTPDQAQNIVRQVGKSTRGAARAVQKNIGKVVAGTLGLSGERMSRVDTAWLRMDGASNLMMIVGVWVLEPGITHAALCQRIEERLLKYDRFRQRVVEDAAGATWVEDPEFDIARHVARMYSREGGALRDQALAEIYKPIQAEWSIPDDDGQTDVIN